MSLISTIATLMIHKHLTNIAQSNTESAFKFLMINYSKIIYRILWSFLGIVVASIVVATRSDLTPALLSSNYSGTAGLEIVGFFIILIFGFVFGAITGVLINEFLRFKTR
jgi:hypothetical protein